MLKHCVRATVNADALDKALVEMFGLSSQARYHIQARLTHFYQHQGQPGCSIVAFAEQLCDWLIHEKLLPLHVLPFDFKRFMIEICDSQDPFFVRFTVAKNGLH